MTTVTVHYESIAIDAETGKPARWRQGFDEAYARKHLRKIAAGKMKDPDGVPWPDVRAWIEA